MEFSKMTAYLIKEALLLIAMPADELTSRQRKHRVFPRVWGCL